MLNSFENILPIIMNNDNVPLETKRQLAGLNRHSYSLFNQSASLFNSLINLTTNIVNYSGLYFTDSDKAANMLKTIFVKFKKLLTCYSVDNLVKKSTENQATLILIWQIIPDLMLAAEKNGKIMPKEMKDLFNGMRKLLAENLSSKNIMIGEVLYHPKGYPVNHEADSKKSHCTIN